MCDGPGARLCRELPGVADPSSARRSGPCRTEAVGSVRCTCGTGLTHSSLDSPARPPHRQKQRALKPWSFPVAYLEQAFPSAASLLPWKRQHRALWQPQLPFLAFSFPIHHRIPAQASCPGVTTWPPGPRCTYDSRSPKPLFPEARGAVLWVEVLPGDIMRILRIQPRQEGAGHSRGNTGRLCSL